MFVSEFIRLNTRLVTSFSRQLYHALLPAMCVLCHYPARDSSSLCMSCHRDLPILPHRCRQCGYFLPYNSQQDNENILCGACLRHPPPFNVTHALFPYATPVIELIIKLKFQQQLSHAQALGELMSNAISIDWYAHKPLPELIIPVPLHRQRLRERGFNQALEIARPIAKTLAIPVDITGIRRIRNTRAQSSLPAARRKDNIAHAFAAERDYHGSHVAILDDVITTGSTIRELSKELKCRGASRIDVWCCARRG